jgi:glycosyltransferase involved in cell wall biosynthesis
VIGRLRRRRAIRPGAILYVVESLGWVGERRLDHLRRHLPDLDFELLTAAELARLHRRGGTRDVPVYYSTWRTVHGLLARGDCALGDEDLRRSMTSVTSHQDIGGGLNPDAAIPPGVAPASAFAEATALLRRFGVVTANSSGLHALLRDAVPGLVYAPNGVDAGFFRPGGGRRYDPARPRVGWVVRRRAAKNAEATAAATPRLRELGYDVRALEIDKGAAGDALLGPEEMLALYRGLDWYLVASWHEGTPNPALEAAACGVPPVTTRVGNMVDLVRDGENGFFVEPDADSIVAAFERLRERPAGEHERLAAAVRADIEREWTWERNAQAYRPAFERLLRAVAA